MSGFSLIEIVIALFVVSVGLLGIAHLQVEALKVSNEAYSYVVMGVRLASMKERLRVDYPGWQAEKIIWQQQNQQLMKNSWSDCWCDQAVCHITLRWYGYTMTAKVKR